MTPSARPPSASIRLARPDIGAREQELVAEVLASDVLALGPFGRRFETGVAAIAGRREGVTSAAFAFARNQQITTGDGAAVQPRCLRIPAFSVERAVARM